jgi:hypothetical protein
MQPQARSWIWPRNSLAMSRYKIVFRRLLADDILHLGRWTVVPCELATGVFVPGVERRI